jgi:hypothetical protein
MIRLLKAQGCFILGRALSKWGNHKAAVKQLERGLALEPKDLSALCWLGWCYRHPQYPAAAPLPAYSQQNPPLVECEQESFEVLAEHRAFVPSLACSLVLSTHTASARVPLQHPAGHALATPATRGTHRPSPQQSSYTFESSRPSSRIRRRDATAALPFYGSR